MQENGISLSFEQIRTILRVYSSVPITLKISKFSDPVDVITLSNGIQVGRLSTQTAAPYGYAMFLIGDKQVNPSSIPGKQYLRTFCECLNEVEAGQVNTIAFKVFHEREIANGKRK